jgi:hypothetical protein
MKLRKPKPGERLKISTVDFEFEDPRLESSVIIRFCHEDGKACIVSVFYDGDENVAYVVNNRDARYKPCMTHAKEILAYITKTPPKTEFEKQRRAAASKPGLGVPLGSFRVFK